MAATEYKPSWWCTEQREMPSMFSPPAELQIIGYLYSGSMLDTRCSGKASKQSVGMQQTFQRET